MSVVMVCWDTSLPRQRRCMSKGESDGGDWSVQKSGSSSFGSNIWMKECLEMS